MERQEHEPLLMGAAEAAGELGVRQANLRVLSGLPKPYGKVRATTLWRSNEIKALARKRRYEARQAKRRAEKTNESKEIKAA